MANWDPDAVIALLEEEDGMTVTELAWEMDGLRSTWYRRLEKMEESGRTESFKYLNGERVYYPAE
jgi:predicted transcriptional regulator